MTTEAPIAVLMIEDDPGDAGLVRALLSRDPRGAWRLDHRARLAEGLERLDEGGIDAVLLDFSLPDSAGLDSFRAVHGRHPEVPVVILTSLDDDLLAARAVEEGAQDFLVKAEADTRLLSRALRWAIARHRAERALLYDHLTGLANRTLFLDRLGVAIAARRREAESSFALLYLDLDRFKTANDSLGHRAGDELLVAIARRLERTLRPGDTVARLGGDEFAVLAARVRDAAGAVHVARRLQAALAQPFAVSGSEVFVAASIGIVLGDESASDAEAMLRDADLAMYRAKAAGRGRYEVWDQELHRAAMSLLKLEMDLRRAVETRAFVMHYQPIVALESGRIVGFEALTRWKHPERGLIPPAAFIGVAEETGLIAPIGWLVLESACRQGRVWHDRFPAAPKLFMSVNVSGRLFEQEGAVGRLLEILERTGFPAESLRLEVTESVVLDHSAEVIQQLLALRAWGVQLSIDDFGTGYSSLAYLQRFRYDSLKIDRSFVSDMETADGSRTIVETILSLATHLGIGVVAEGVETAGQLERLRGLGCPLGQGYWFAEPQEAAAIEELVASNAVW